MDLIKFPYGLAADIHFHNWNAFSSVSSSGVNNRLDILLAELIRMAGEVRDKGGNTVIIAGDVFHVRGSISPSVLNPVLDAVKLIIDTIGVQVIIIAGNHDLEGKNTSRIGSAVTALEGAGAHVVEHHLWANTENPEKVIHFLSWREDIKELKKELENCGASVRSKSTVIMHAPIDGVITGLPEHGLTDSYLASLKYERIFSGHYHNHKDFGNGVCSIGAIAHHTWSDIGAKAGFILVHEDKIEHRSSRAPKFIHVDENTDTDELPLIVDGNYVRAKIGNVTAQEVSEMREMLDSFNAAGVVIHAIKSPVVERNGVATPTSQSVTVEQSIADYITSESIPNADEVLKKCLLVLNETEEV